MKLENKCDKIYHQGEAECRKAVEKYEDHYLDSYEISRLEGFPGFNCVRDAAERNDGVRQSKE